MLIFMIMFNDGMLVHALAHFQMSPDFRIAAKFEQYVHKIVICQ